MNLTPEEAAKLAEDLLDLGTADGGEAGLVGVGSGPATLPGGRLGNYRVTRLVGTGGMGEVYEAEQDNPRRRVALKVIRSHLLSADVRRRFEHEVRILGSLHHPGIAQIYEAGQFPSQGLATPDGDDAATSPFFAMEFVQGEPLTSYAWSRKLSTRERLELFLRVCQAVEHAHQRGVIHRDLKPANILVTPPPEPGADSKPASSLTDRLGQPKVLDFGVARATDVDLSVTSLRTEIGKLVGTLPYMSPEQASGHAGQLDTRSDVYALGVVLYELLSGKLPYDVKGGAGVANALRVIKEADPAPLSTVDRVFRGDIETIVGKALEKERERRYQSVGELAADVRRYLADEPIVARRASGWYELRKFARRNRALATAAAVAATGLAAGGAVSLGAAYSERAARRDADRTAEREREQRTLAQRRGEELIVEQREARRQAEVARAVNEFVIDLLGSVDPRDSGRATTVAEVLDRVHAEVAELTSRSPAVAGAILTTAGRMYHELGEHAKAVEIMAEAERLLIDSLGPEHIETIRASAERARIRVGAGEIEEGARTLERLLELQRTRFGADDLDTLSTAAALVSALIDADKPQEAERLAEDTEARLLRVAGAADPKYQQTKLTRGMTMERRGLFADAERVYRELLADGLCEKTAEFNVKVNLAVVLRKQGQLDEAEQLLRGVIVQIGEAYGPDHPFLLLARNNLASAMLGKGDHAGAAATFGEIAEAMRQKLGPDHPNVAVVVANRGYCLREAGAIDEAVAAYTEAVEIGARSVGLSNLDTLSNMRGLAETLAKGDRLEEALDVQSRAIAAAASLAEDAEFWVAAFGVDRGYTLAKMSRTEEAERQLTDSFGVLLPLAGPKNRFTQGAGAGLIGIYESSGRTAEADRVRSQLPAPPNEEAAAGAADGK